MAFALVIASGLEGTGLHYRVQDFSLELFGLHRGHGCDGLDPCKSEYFKIRCIPFSLAPAPSSAAEPDAVGGLRLRLTFLTGPSSVCL